jgi:uncharacterized protein YjbI with pentapeptide repeats
MANPEHLARLKGGVDAWNQWRSENPDVRPDLTGADLDWVDLRGVHLSGAFLNKAHFDWADLEGADFRGANLSEAHLLMARLIRANLDGAVLRSATLLRAHLIGAVLTKAILFDAYLVEAHLEGAVLEGANLAGATLRGADLRGAHLGGASLRMANLVDANLSKADLRGADLRWAILIGTIFENANLTDCNVYGVSVWDIRLEGANQSNLVITPSDHSVIQVDNLEVAQFVYLLLNNERIRQVIDTITSKVVLILGRFTPERKVALDAIRDELRKRNYLPILFDFQKPESKDLTGTVTTLANMARFVIADLTDPSSVPHELATIAPGIVVPIQTILLSGRREYAMFPDLRRRYPWVLEPYHYDSEETLMASFNERVIAPAEAKVVELRQR